MNTSGRYQITVFLEDFGIVEHNTKTRVPRSMGQLIEEIEHHLQDDLQLKLIGMSVIRGKLFDEPQT